MGNFFHPIIQKTKNKTPKKERRNQQQSDTLGLLRQADRRSRQRKEDMALVPAAHGPVFAEVDMGVDSSAPTVVRATVVQASTVFYDTPATLGPTSLLTCCHLWLIELLGYCSLNTTLCVCVCVCFFFSLT